MKELVEVVHIGYPKTGTTWVQLEAIPHIPDLLILCKPEPIDRRYRVLMNRFVSSTEFDFDPEFFRREFARLQEENRAAFAPGKIRMINFELLSGELYAGIDAKQMIDRIYRTFGRVKIIVTIREQKGIIESIYKHYVGSGGGLHIREMLYKITSPGVDIWGTRHLFLKFRYDKMVAYCRKLFGEENVKVVPFEWILRDQDRYIREYFDFVGVKVPEGVPEKGKTQNVGISYLGVKLLRCINQVISTPLSDSPLFRSVPFTYTRFIHRLFRPFDEALLSRLSRGRKFVHLKKRWWLRRQLKRLLTLFVRREEVNYGEHPFWANLIKFWNWPDTDSTRLKGSGETIGEEIERLYGESNRRLVELTGLPLAELGYAVADIGEVREVEAGESALVEPV